MRWLTFCDGSLDELLHRFLNTLVTLPLAQRIHHQLVANDREPVSQERLGQVQQEFEQHRDRIEHSARQRLRDHGELDRTGGVWSKGVIHSRGAEFVC